MHDVGVATPLALANDYRFDTVFLKPRAGAVEVIKLGIRADADAIDPLPVDFRGQYARLKPNQRKLGFQAIGVIGEAKRAGLKHI